MADLRREHVNKKALHHEGHKGTQRKTVIVQRALSFVSFVSFVVNLET
jgi:hypothetical protein